MNYNVPVLLEISTLIIKCTNEYNAVRGYSLNNYSKPHPLTDEVIRVEEVIVPYLHGEYGW